MFFATTKFRLKFSRTSRFIFENGRWSFYICTFSKVAAGLSVASVSSEYLHIFKVPSRSEMQRRRTLDDSYHVKPTFHLQLRSIDEDFSCDYLTSLVCCVLSKDVFPFSWTNAQDVEGQFVALASKNFIYIISIGSGEVVLKLNGSRDKHTESMKLFTLPGLLIQGCDGFCRVWDLDRLLQPFVPFVQAGTASSSVRSSSKLSQPLMRGSSIYFLCAT
jgi:WD40 repeat protein